MLPSRELVLIIHHDDQELVEQLVELSLRDVRAADHRLDLKVDFIFKIVDAQRALRALIPVKMIQNWKSLLEERAKSVVTSLLPRVQSNLTIRNLDGVDEDGDGDGDRRGTSVSCIFVHRESLNFKITYARIQKKILTLDTEKQVRSLRTSRTK